MLYTLGIHQRTKQEETKAKISALLELTFQCRRTACVTDNTIVLWERRWGGKGWGRVGGEQEPVCAGVGHGASARPELSKLSDTCRPGPVVLPKADHWMIT